MARKTKKLTFSEREMIQYLYNQNKELEKENARLSSENARLKYEFDTYKTGIQCSWDEPAIGASHGW